jgi:predicted nuclease of predicted toxin-antitoxin system
MKFLLDQDVYLTTQQLLRALGHDVLPVADIGLAEADDEVLLQVAHQRQRIFVTRDRDYGNLVFVKAYNAGVIYLRIRPSTEIATHAQLERVLVTYTEQQLQKAFVVVEPDGHRFRHLSG